LVTSITPTRWSPSQGGHGRHTGNDVPGGGGALRFPPLFYAFPAYFRNAHNFETLVFVNPRQTPNGIFAPRVPRCVCLCARACLPSITLCARSPAQEDLEGKLATVLGENRELVASLAGGSAQARVAEWLRWAALSFPERPLPRSSGHAGSAKIPTPRRQLSAVPGPSACTFFPNHVIARVRNVFPTHQSLCFK